MVTYDNLIFTRMCIESVLSGGGSTGEASVPYELIVVDNASQDDTPEFLREVEASNGNVRVIVNDSNRGFSAANNQGLAAARGNMLVLLNNDTIVTAGWLEGLAGHLVDPAIGTVGPVTNRIGNEAEIEATYSTYGEMLGFASRYTARHVGELFDIRTSAMFCLALRREVYEHVGPLDETYGIGLLEDDDYSMRVRRAGYRVVCAEDVFVHHFGEASFGKLVPTGEYADVIARNRQRYEEKWGRWEQYDRRQTEEYLELPRRLHKLVVDLPPHAVLLVVSKGDDALLDLGGRRGWHFPRTADGRYAGHYPETGAEAVRHLRELQAAGADHLVIPHPALWWLDHYIELRAHLQRQCELVASGNAGLVFRL